MSRSTLSGLVKKFAATSISTNLTKEAAPLTCMLMTSNNFSTTSSLKKCSGRYGQKLVKLWEQPKYTTKPLKVWRTGGRLPHELDDGSIVPGRVWCSRHGGGKDREWWWVDHNRLTHDDVLNGVHYQEKIVKIMEDDNRSGLIALVTGPLKQRWILATVDMKEGGLITNTAKAIPGATYSSGDACPVKLLPSQTVICSLEFFPGKGAQIARSAGNFATIQRHVDDRTIIKMPSGRDINVDSNCVAVVGRVSKVEHNTIGWKSPFYRRILGLRPKKGIKVRRDARYARRSLPPHPCVIIGDKMKFQKQTRLED